MHFRAHYFHKIKLVYTTVLIFHSVAGTKVDNYGFLTTFHSLKGHNYNRTPSLHTNLEKCIGKNLIVRCNYWRLIE